VREYDQQLLESAAVRRSRLRDALLFGRLRTQRAYSDSFGRLIASFVLAVALCAGCVGWSYLQHALAQTRASTHSSTSVTPRAPSPSVTNGS
jgi:hypothetical protein